MLNRINNQSPALANWNSGSSAQTSAAATQKPGTDAISLGSDSFVDPDKKIKAGIQNDFRTRFARVAGNKQAFHSLLGRVYGSYDKKAAETLRRRTQSGDTSWLPKIRFVGRETLQGANGAYDAKKQLVYLSRDLRSNPSLAASTYTEEVGHHIDTQIKKTDTRGDEGEMFRRVLNGEQLSRSQESAIRSENDKGVITVDGKKTEVEFFFKKIRKAFKRVSRTVRNTVRTGTSWV